MSDDFVDEDDGPRFIPFLSFIFFLSPPPPPFLPLLLIKENVLRRTKWEKRAIIFSVLYQWNTSVEHVALGWKSTGSLKIDWNEWSSGTDDNDASQLFYCNFRHIWHPDLTCCNLIWSFRWLWYCFSWIWLMWLLNKTPLIQCHDPSWIVFKVILIMMVVQMLLIRRIIIIIMMNSWSVISILRKINEEILYNLQLFPLVLYCHPFSVWWWWIFLSFVTMSDRK